MLEFITESTPNASTEQTSDFDTTGIVNQY